MFIRYTLKILLKQSEYIERHDSNCGTSGNMNIFGSVYVEGPPLTLPWKTQIYIYKCLKCIYTYTLHYNIPSKLGKSAYMWTRVVIFEFPPRISFGKAPIFRR